MSLITGVCGTSVNWDYAQFPRSYLSDTDYLAYFKQTISEVNSHWKEYAADVKFVFDDGFPYPEVTVLSTNYRCPRNVVKASNFISNLNRLKIEKSLVPATDVQCPIRLIEMPADDTENYEDWEFCETVRLLKHLVENRKPGEDIMVLARFNFPLRRLEQEFRITKTSD
jgi:superfamily I DNA/RNA helicase